MFENAECPEGVAADVVGHLKPTMTYGLYSGITQMDLRAKWMEKAISYPSSEEVPIRPRQFIHVLNSLLGRS